MLTDAEATAADDEDVPQQGMRHEVVDNVVQQLAGSELASACHVFGSSALQRAMRLGSIPQRVALATPLLCAEPTLVLTDKYASHVLEGVLSLVYDGLGTGSEWEEGEACLGSLLVGFCDTLIAGGVGGLRAAMQDRHGTYVLRSLLRTLSGRRSGERGEAAGDKGGKGGGKGDKGGKGGGGKGNKGGKGDKGGKGGGGKGGGGKGGGEAGGGGGKGGGGKGGGKGGEGGGGEGDGGGGLGDSGGGNSSGG